MDPVPCILHGHINRHEKPSPALPLTSHNTLTMLARCHITVPNPTLSRERHHARHRHYHPIPVLILTCMWPISKGLGSCLLSHHQDKDDFFSSVCNDEFLQIKGESIDDLGQQNVVGKLLFIVHDAFRYKKLIRTTLQKG